MSGPLHGLARGPRCARPLRRLLRVEGAGALASAPRGGRVWRAMGLVALRGGWGGSGVLVGVEEGGDCRLRGGCGVFAAFRWRWFRWWACVNGEEGGDELLVGWVVAVVVGNEEFALPRPDLPVERGEATPQPRDSRALVREHVRGLVS